MSLEKELCVYCKSDITNLDLLNQTCKYCSSIFDSLDIDNLNNNDEYKIKGGWADGLTRDEAILYGSLNCYSVNAFL